MKKWLFRLGAAAIVAGVLLGLKFLWSHFNKVEPVTVYNTRTVSRGDMRRVISATGTVEPEELVNVGAQVGGMISRFGRDVAGNAVDYGSRVKAGQVLAVIDDSLYAAEVNVAKAERGQAIASISSAEASVRQAKAKYELAKINFDRAKRLRPNGSISQSDYDSALAEYTSCEAANGVAEASLEQARAKLASSEASLEKVQRNLGYCTITSPVDGIIIDRRVNIGQTVNASMNAPSLFLIAKDLRKMQVWVSVNEADIGELRTGLPVVFTVDAFPRRTFRGEVRKVRLNATMSQNVVTYVVEINTDNSDGTLLPYLTANVKFILDERKNALFVPNAALRYTPAGKTVPVLKNGEAAVWIPQNGKPAAQVVRTGLNDGRNTEILDGFLKEGSVLITGERISTGGGTTVGAAEEAKRGAGSPFLPTPPKRPSSRKAPADGGK